MWEQMNVIGKTTWESLIELNQITARNIERLSQQELAFVGDCTAIALYYLRASMQVKDLQETLRNEARLATDCGEKWMANAHRVLKISLQTQNELGQWLNDILHGWDGQKVTEQVQQTRKADPPSRLDACSLGWEKNTFIVDDPMLALITRFVWGEGQLHLSEGEFMLDQIAAIQRFVAQFPPEQRNRRAIEWIEAHAKRYRQAWQKKAVYARAAQARCPDCTLAEEGLTAHCGIHHRWLELLNRYIACEVSSRRYVEDTLRLLTEYKTRLKMSALRGVRGTGQSVAAGLDCPRHRFAPS